MSRAASILSFVYQVAIYVKAWIDTKFLKPAINIWIKKSRKRRPMSILRNSWMFVGVPSHMDHA
jgi:hypothetical protein